MVILPLVGGVLIGLSASILLLWTGRIAGISGILAGVLKPAAGEVAWRVVFVAGLLTGGLLLAALYPEALVVSAPGSFGMIALAGVLVGYGTRLGSGCTAGHGVCGMSRLSPRSFLATVTFIAAGAVTVYFVHPGIGGTP